MNKARVSSITREQKGLEPTDWGRGRIGVAEEGTHEPHECFDESAWTHLHALNGKGGTT